MKTNLLDIRNCDCMDLMREYPDNHFELAIVDPPYGIGAAQNKRGGTQYGKAVAPSKLYEKKSWDDSPPDQSYFDELERVSVNRIIWGGNYYPQGASPCWIVWDKQTGNNGYADCELAWTSFKSAVRQFTFLWHGMLRGEPGERIHPTQKPVALYKWLLQNYAKEGDKILDTHMGSGSIAIACHYMGFNLTACELDEDYYNAACERIKRETAQTELALF